MDPSAGGDRPPPPTRLLIDMAGRMVDEEASRLGSLQTELGGGATSAISGICGGCGCGGG